MTETLGNPFQELSSIKLPSFSQMRQDVRNKFNEKKYVDIPSPTREQVLQNEINKQMKVEENLLKSRGLSEGDYQTRLEERRQQVEGRLYRDDPRFAGMVTEPGIASGYRPVNANAFVDDARNLNERLGQYEGGAKVENPREVFKNKPSSYLQNRVDPMPSVGQLTRLSPRETEKLEEERQRWRYKNKRIEAERLLRQYLDNSPTGMDAAIEKHIRKRYGNDIWDSLFTQREDKNEVYNTIPFKPDSENY
jgi:hypothetical protein